MNSNMHATFRDLIWKMVIGTLRWMKSLRDSLLLDLNVEAGCINVCPKAWFLADLTSKRGVNDSSGVTTSSHHSTVLQSWISSLRKIKLTNLTVSIADVGSEQRLNELVRCSCGISMHVLYRIISSCTRDWIFRV